MFPVSWSARYCHPLPSNHRFPMIKYELLPLQLLHEGILHQTDLFTPKIISNDPILRVHDAQYFHRLLNLELDAKEQRISGFPHSSELIFREIEIASGTVECAINALNSGLAFNIAGGTHHAFSNRAEGFCLLNDQAIAAQFLIDQCFLKKVLIVDLDVHQGNGTAEIFKSNPDVFTFSMHGKKNYPFKKEQSDLDIELEDGTGNELYLQKLNESLELILNSFRPEFIFYQAGVDVLKTDQLGRMNLDLEGCYLRDQIVFSTAKSLSIPIVTCMGGGYSRDIRVIVKAHTNTFKCALSLL